jgi:arsenate reductase
MAEGIANALSKPRLVFSSAGLDPRPVDLRTVRFLKDKGIDISHQKSKTTDQVANFEHYEVLIALDRQARRIFPTPPTKTICLDWNVADPSNAQGTHEEVQRAYEETYRFIEGNVRDLVEAIIGDHNIQETK